jgi:hypothetical protein
VAGSALGGILGGTAGLFGGAMLGASMEGPCNCDDPGLMGAIYGGLIGESVGLALGTHLGNGLKGNLLLDLAAAAGGSVLAITMGSAGGDGALLIPAAALQVALVVGTEVGIARQKARVP